MFARGPGLETHRALGGDVGFTESRSALDFPLEFTLEHGIAVSWHSCGLALQI